MQFDVQIYRYRKCLMHGDDEVEGEHRGRRKCTVEEQGRRKHSLIVREMRGKKSSLQIFATWSSRTFSLDFLEPPKLHSTSKKSLLRWRRFNAGNETSPCSGRLTGYFYTDEWTYREEAGDCPAIVETSGTTSLPQKSRGDSRETFLFLSSLLAPCHFTLLPYCQGFPHPLLFTQLFSSVTHKSTRWRRFICQDLGKLFDPTPLITRSRPLPNFLLLLHRIFQCDSGKGGKGYRTRCETGISRVGG